MLETIFLTGLYLSCGNGVHPEVLHAIVKTESAKNPYVIANVTDAESYFLKNKEEAIFKANELKANGKKYSAGLMQIYSENYEFYGLTNETVFDYCTNIQTGANILKECFKKSVKESDENNDSHLNKALSCYYSGNFKRGFVNDKNLDSSYVDRVKNNYVSIFEVPSFSSYEYSSYEINDSKESIEPITKENYQEPVVSNSWDIFNDFTFLEGKNNENQN